MSNDKAQISEFLPALFSFWQAAKYEKSEIWDFDIYLIFACLPKLVQASILTFEILAVVFLGLLQYVLWCRERAGRPSIKMDLDILIHRKPHILDHLTCIQFDG